MGRPELWHERIAAFDRAFDHGKPQPLPEVPAGREDRPCADSWAERMAVTWSASGSLVVAEATLELVNLSSLQTDASVEIQAKDVCARLRSLLAEHSLSPDDLISTTLLLRSMADFAAVNAIYGQLFTRPLPPARVTVACGSELPAGCSLFLHATADRSGPKGTNGLRQGLHVQSRSYWAPANIGPYSQAIRAGDLVFVAGQIPLVPATMELFHGLPSPATPPPATTVFRQQTQLALQHLWAVGTATGISWWTHGVAYLAAGHSSLSGAARARLAGALWAHMHAADEPDSTTEDEGGDAEGPDLWDRTHGAARHEQALAAEAVLRPLPDHARTVPATPRARVPAFFAVEVAELPRGAPVEWHSLGLANSPAISLDCIHSPELVTHECRWHTPELETGGRAVRCYEVVVCEDWEAQARGLLKALGVDPTASRAPHPAVTVYTPFPTVFASASYSVQIVPCKRLWGSEAMEMAAGVVMRTGTVVCGPVEKKQGVEVDDIQ